MLNIFVGILTAIGSIATAVAAFIALYTLREVQKQRQATYRPDLLISDTNVMCKLNGSAISSPPIHWANDTESFENGDPTSPSVTLFNIGLGAAKEVAISFETSLEALVGQIRFSDRQNEFLFDLKKKSLSAEFINGAAPWKVFIPLYNDMRRTYPYVLPTSIEKGPYLVKLPLSYLVLLSISFYQAYKQVGHFYRQNITITPSLQIRLDYYDIGNKMHTKRYDLRVEPYFLEADVIQAMVVVRKDHSTNVEEM